MPRDDDDRRREDDEYSDRHGYGRNDRSERRERDGEDERERRGRGRDDDRGRGASRDSDRDSGSRARGRDDRNRDDSRGSGRDRGSDRDDRRGGSRDDGRGERKKESKSIEVKLKDVRLSFESLFKKKKFGDDDQNPKFQGSFLIDKRKQADLIDDCWKAIDDAIYAEWGNNPPRIADDKLALRDGNDKDYDGYEGMMVVAARADRRPKVFDRDLTPIHEEDGIIYSGCYVNAVVRFWPQNNKWGKRINASLEGVQFVRDGDAFTAPPLRDDAFDKLEDKDRGGRDRGRDRGRDDDRGRSSSRGRDDDRGRGRDRGRDDFDDRGDSPYGEDRDRGRGGRDRDNVDRSFDNRRRDRDRGRGRDDLVGGRGRDDEIPF